MDHVSVHWRFAWVGFDLTLAAVFCAAALAGRRDSLAFPDLLLAGAVLLLCDAWFDIATAASVRELVGAVIEALVAEVPLALYCLAFARRVRRSAAGTTRFGRRHDEGAQVVDRHLPDPGRGRRHALGRGGGVGGDSAVEVALGIAAGWAQR